MAAAKRLSCAGTKLSRTGPGLSSARAKLPGTRAGTRAELSRPSASSGSEPVACARLLGTGSSRSTHGGTTDCDCSRAGASSSSGCHPGPSSDAGSRGRAGAATCA